MNLFSKKKQISKALNAVLSIKNSPEFEGIYSNIPAALTNSSDIILWHNSGFDELFSFYCIGKKLPSLFDAAAPAGNKLTIRGKAYRKEQCSIQYENETYILYKFILRDAVLDNAQMPAVCQIRIDNYDTLLSNAKLKEETDIVSKIYLKINEFAERNYALCEQYDRDRFLLVFECRMLNKIMSDRFSILNDVHDITTASGDVVTLSIAVGVGKTLSESQDYAQTALEMAQGRGGDQAVVLNRDKYFFYGGLNRNVDRKSQVKIRQKSRALKNLFEQCSDVFIMGHDVADLDSFGSSLGIFRLARSVSKKAYIILDKTNLNIAPLMNIIETNKEYLIVKPDDARSMIKPASVLVVLDTQIAKYTEAPHLFGPAKNIVVIDHHLQGTSRIEASALFFHEPHASSTCEIVTEIIQFAKADLRQIEAEALLAGITMDTKGFSFNTGVRTFEAASYLRSCGADTTNIRQLLQDDLSTFISRAEIVARAEMISGGIAVSSVPKNTPNSVLIAAQAADSLLTIRGIACSFVAASSNGQIVISGRSLGSINVQVILEKLGGGGNPTVAGVKIKAGSFEEVHTRLLSAINEYLTDTQKDGKHGNI